MSIILWPMTTYLSFKMYWGVGNSVTFWDQKLVFQIQDFDTSSHIPLSSLNGWVLLIRPLP
jgi:hypothetical protein